MKKVFFAALVLVLTGFGCQNVFGPTEIIQEHKDPIDSQDQVPDEAEVILSSPEEQEVVSSPFVIEGEAFAPEGMIDWRILARDGSLLDQGSLELSDASKKALSPFTQDVFIPTLDESEFVFELYRFDAETDELNVLVSRPLQVTQVGRTSVRVYFIDPELQESGDCSAVDFEKRTVAKTDNIAELAINELLEGPTSEWAITSMPEGTELLSLTIDDGLAIVDFGAEYSERWNGGSCYVLSLRSQIEETLLQFDDIDRVEIRVNGESETILQP